MKGGGGRIPSLLRIASSRQRHREVTLPSLPFMGFPVLGFLSCQKREGVCLTAAQRHRGTTSRDTDPVPVGTDSWGSLAQSSHSSSSSDGPRSNTQLPSHSSSSTPPPPQRGRVPTHSCPVTPPPQMGRVPTHSCPVTPPPPRRLLRWAVFQHSCSLRFVSPISSGLTYLLLLVPLSRDLH